MLALEQSITELHALFVEMAALVDEQGEMVDRILDNVQNTEAYVEKAVEDVHQAARYDHFQKTCYKIIEKNSFFSRNFRINLQLVEKKCGCSYSAL